MEAPGEICLRLLGALETLAAEEQCTVRNGAIDATLNVQQRAEPIIARLAELLASPAVAAQAAPRLSAVQSQRLATLELLQARLAEASVARSAYLAMHSRLEGMKAAYGTRRVAGSILSPCFSFRQSA